jgi:hypothetical protein
MLTELIFWDVKIKGNSSRYYRRCIDIWDTSGFDDQYFPIVLIIDGIDTSTTAIASMSMSQPITSMAPSLLLHPIRLLARNVDCFGCALIRKALTRSLDRKSTYPQPRMDAILDIVDQTKVWSTIYMPMAFHKLHIHEPYCQS